MYTGNLYYVYSAEIESAIELISLPRAQNVSVVNQGESVTFICRTTGSTLNIAWSSEEYIGGGEFQLSFLSIDPPEMIVNSSISASFIILTMVDTVNGDTVLKSQLHIVNVSVMSTVTVMCYNNDQGVNASITFSTGKNFVCTQHTLLIFRYTSTYYMGASLGCFLGPPIKTI